MFSARGAGILGFSILGSKPCYALDDDMRLDLDGMRGFLAAHRGERVLCFGFTYVVWKHVIRALEAQGLELELRDGILIHGGGWKKLAGEAVSREEFKERARRALGVVRRCWTITAWRSRLGACIWSAPGDTSTPASGPM